MGRFIDLTGQKFGKLTVIERAENRQDKNGKPVTCWKCLCDCGNTTVSRSQNLRNGDSKSCGHCPINFYDLSGEYGVGYTSSGDKFLFDLEDFAKISKYTWCSDRDGYIISNLQVDGKHKTIKMHRIIMNPSKDEQVDHINHIEWDNRKSNLRICSNMQNNWNKNITKANKSGYKGIWFRKERNRWVAEIKCNGKKHYIGMFKTAEEASKAYEQKAKELFGEFYCHN